MPIRSVNRIQSQEKIRELKKLLQRREQIKEQEKQWMNEVGAIMNVRFHTALYAESALNNEISFLQRVDPGVEPINLHLENKNA